MIVNLIVNECQFEGDLLFGLEERHVAGNPKTKGLKAGDRLFLCKKPCLLKKNYGLIKKV